MFGKICLLLRLCSVLVLATLVACDSEQQINSDSISFDGDSIEVSVPQRLRSLQAIDLSAVRSIATVNGVETDLQLTESGQYTGQISVPAQSEFTVRIDFVELFFGRQLTLARVEQNVTTNTTDTSLTLLSDDYDYSFDFDGDNASNILERQFETSPLDPQQVPQIIDVDIFAQLPVELVAAGFSNYEIVATIGTETASTDATAGEFRQVFTVVQQENLTAQVRLVENVTGRGITIGTQTRDISDLEAGDLIVFDSVAWNLEFDQDADGSTDVEELIAGTDLLTADQSTGSEPESVAFAVAFDIPAEIVNTESVFATLTVDGQNISLSRMVNTYTGTGTSVAGATVSIEAQIMDTFGSAALVLATFSGQTTPVPDATLRLDGFNTSIDTDSDGVFNFLELAQGTDPFNGPLQCTPVSETFTATISDDAFVENTDLINEEFLRVQVNRRASIIRFKYDEDPGTIISASLNLSVGADAGSGRISVFAESNFEWTEQAATLAVPTGQLAGSRQDNWELGEAYSFPLNPALVTGDLSLIIRQVSGNDVAFQSSNGAAPPVLEVTIERCQ